MKSIITAFLILTAGSVSGQIATGNLLVNSDAETGDLTGWSTNGIAPFVTSIQNPGDLDWAPRPHSGTYGFHGGRSFQNFLHQTNVLIGRLGITASHIDTGSLLANVSFWSMGDNQGDSARVVLTFINGTGSLVSTQATPFITLSNLVYTNYQGSFPIPTGTRGIVYSIHFLNTANSLHLHSVVDDCSLTVSGDPLASIAPILSIDRAVQIVWPSLINRQYQVQWATNFGTPDTNWWNLGTPVFGTGMSNSVCDRLGELEHRYYRVIALP